MLDRYEVVALLAITHTVPVSPLVLIPTLLLASVLVAVALLLANPSRAAQKRTLYFYLIALACLLLAGGWIVGVLI